MPLRTPLLTVVLCLLFQFGLSLWYTGSKENDYPRIGKREKESEKDFSWLKEDKFLKEAEDWISHEQKDSKISDSQIPIVAIPPSLFFKILDKNGDDIITRKEFKSSWEKQLKILYQIFSIKTKIQHDFV